jgi:hypothetical protein
VDFDGTDPIAFVLSANLHRRHLSAPDRKFIAAEASEMYEAEARERMLAGASADRREGGKATEKAAAAAGVPVREVEKAKRVSEKAPVLKEAVLAGVASLDAAATLADEPEEILREILREGPQGLRVGRSRGSGEVTRAPRSASARPPREHLRKGEVTR